MNSDDEKTSKAVEKVLREPVAAQFSEQAWRIRTNLIIASTIALVMGLAELRIQPDSSFLGLKFSGLSDVAIRMTLAAIIIYLLFHFVWVAFDSLIEWRLRVTGTRSSFQTAAMFFPDHADAPIEPHQSTLYNWWFAQKEAIGRIGVKADKFLANQDAWKAELAKMMQAHPHSPDWGNFGRLVQLLEEWKTETRNLSAGIEANTKMMTDPRIAVSLRRFDGWYELFLRSQNLRWLLIEFVAPVAFASISLWVVLQHLA